MRITVIGPRSVGKSTTSKVLAKRLGFTYISSDKELDKECKDVGGITGVLQEKNRDLLFEKANALFNRVFNSKENIVFDLAGGSLSTRDSKANKMDFSVVKDNSLVIGLLPFKDREKSLDFLFQREQFREHWKDIDKDTLYLKTIDTLDEFLKNSSEIVNEYYYVENKKTPDIVKDLIEIIKKNATTGI